MCRKSKKIDTTIITRAARRIVGAEITMRIELMMALAGVGNKNNHYILKTANVMAAY